MNRAHNRLLATDRRTPLQRLLQLGNAAELVERAAVINFEQFRLFERCHMFDRDIGAVYIAQDAAALLFEFMREISYLGGGGQEQLVELPAEGGIVGRDRRQHAGMIEREVERLLEFANPLDDSGIEQRVEVSEGIGLLMERTDAAKLLHMLFGKRRYVGVGENFNQRDFEGRERK